MDKRTIWVCPHRPEQEFEMILPVPRNNDPVEYITKFLGDILSCSHFAWDFVDGIS